MAGNAVKFKRIPFTGHANGVITSAKAGVQKAREKGTTKSRVSRDWIPVEVYPGENRGGVTASFRVPLLARPAVPAENPAKRGASKLAVAPQCVTELTNQSTDIQHNSKG